MEGIFRWKTVCCKTVSLEEVSGKGCILSRIRWVKYQVTSSLNTALNFFMHSQKIRENRDFKTISHPLGNMCIETVLFLLNLKCLHLSTHFHKNLLNK